MWAQGRRCGCMIMTGLQPIGFNMWRREKICCALDKDTFFNNLTTGHTFCDMSPTFLTKLNTLLPHVIFVLLFLILFTDHFISVSSFLVDFAEYDTAQYSGNWIQQNLFIGLEADKEKGYKYQKDWKCERVWSYWEISGHYFNWTMSNWRGDRSLLVVLLSAYTLLYTVVLGVPTQQDRCLWSGILFDWALGQLQLSISFCCSFLWHGQSEGHVVYLSSLILYKNFVEKLSPCTWTKSRIHDQ